LYLGFLVVVVGVVLLVVAGALVDDFEEEELLPHPATATVLARATATVRIAVSSFLLMGRAPIVAR
jgi:hypothetical protein